MIQPKADAQPDPAATGLRLVQCSKNFGDFQVLKSIDLHVERGEFLTLLGPSGSGKTTLLMMIAGFLDPDSGELLLNGYSIKNRPPEKREFGMVFQGYALFPHMTVRQNIAYPLEVRNKPVAEISARVDQMLELVQLQGLEARLPHQLSGGQQQRVALARALSFDPQLLLLDEPLGALDKKLRAAVQTELKSLHKRLGTTFIYVTHDQEEALSMSDRIVIMNHGKIIQTGTPAQLYERPASAFAADFLGRSNFFHVTVLDADADSATLTCKLADYFIVQRRPAGALAPQVGSPIVLALRPEKIEISPAGQCKMINCLPGVITDLSYFGATLSLSADVDGVGNLTADLNLWRNDKALKEGGEIQLGWSEDAAVIVSEDT